MTDFQQQIRNAYEHLTNIQRTIADYFLEHLDTIPFKRLEELADLIGVSTTSVIRFTRSIGYQGYGDMQQELQQSILGKASLPERLKSSIQAEGDNHLLLRTFQTDVDNIQETLSVLSETVLSEAVSSMFRQEMSISSEFAATFLWLTIWGTAWDRSSREYIWWTGFPWPIPSRS